MKRIAELVGLESAQYIFFQPRRRASTRRPCNGARVPPEFPMRFLVLCVATTVVAIAAATVAATRRLPDQTPDHPRPRFRNRLDSRSQGVCHPMAFPILFSVN